MKIEKIKSGSMIRNWDPGLKSVVKLVDELSLKVHTLTKNSYCTVFE